MATLHLPKKRPVSSQEEPLKRAQRHLDEGLEESVPASDPVSATAPGSTREDESRASKHPT